MATREVTIADLQPIFDRLDRIESNIIARLTRLEKSYEKSPQTQSKDFHNAIVAQLGASMFVSTVRCFQHIFFLFFVFYTPMQPCNHAPVHTYMHHVFFVVTAVFGDKLPMDRYE